MAYTIYQDGKPLHHSKYTIDEVNKTFSSNENNLVLDFSNEDNWNFKTGDDCTFNTLSYCIFKTGAKCTFQTGGLCTFNTLYNCTFNTLSDCTFKTGSTCTFKTGQNCTFNTYSNGTFHTGHNCTFLIWYNGFIKCEDESSITILLHNKKINTFTIPNQIMYIKNNATITTWSNKDLILNCKDPDYKDACNFFMKKD